MSHQEYTKLRKVLEDLSLSKYYDTFVANEVDDSTLPYVTYRSLLDMGVPVGPALKISSFLQREQSPSLLNNESEESEVTEEESSTTEADETINKSTNAADTTVTDQMKDSDADNKVNSDDTGSSANIEAPTKTEVLGESSKESSETARDKSEQPKETSPVQTESGQPQETAEQEAQDRKHQPKDQEKEQSKPALPNPTSSTTTTKSSSIRRAITNCWHRVISAFTFYVILLFWTIPKAVVKRIFLLIMWPFKLLFRLFKWIYLQFLRLFYYLLSIWPSVVTAVILSPIAWFLLKELRHDLVHYGTVHPVWLAMVVCFFIFASILVVSVYYIVLGVPATADNSDKSAKPPTNKSKID